MLGRNCPSLLFVEVSQLLLDRQHLFSHKLCDLRCRVSIRQYQDFSRNLRMKALHFRPEISNCDCQARGPGWAWAETSFTWAWQSSAPSIVTGEAFHLRQENVHCIHFVEISPIAVYSPSLACEILWSSYSSPTTSGQVPIAQFWCIFVLKISGSGCCALDHRYFSTPILVPWMHCAHMHSLRCSLWTLKNFQKSRQKSVTYKWSTAGIHHLIWKFVEAPNFFSCLISAHPFRASCAAHTKTTAKVCDGAKNSTAAILTKHVLVLETLKRSANSWAVVTKWQNWLNSESWEKSN